MINILPAGIIPPVITVQRLLQSLLPVVQPGLNPEVEIRLLEILVPITVQLIRINHQLIREDPIVEVTPGQVQVQTDHIIRRVNHLRVHIHPVNEAIPDQAILHPEVLVSLLIEAQVRNLLPPVDPIIVVPAIVLLPLNHLLHRDLLVVEAVRNPAPAPADHTVVEVQDPVVQVALIVVEAQVAHTVEEVHGPAVLADQVVQVPEVRVVDDNILIYSN